MTELEKLIERIWINCIHKNITGFTLTQEKRAKEEMKTEILALMRKEAVEVRAPCTKHKGNDMWWLDCVNAKIIKAVPMSFFEKTASESDVKWSESKKEICGYCKKPFDYDFWMKSEDCKHCHKFLDNPPFLEGEKE